MLLGRIHDLTTGDLDKRPPKAVAPRGVWGHTPPENFYFRASEKRFPAFSGLIWSGLIALKSPPPSLFFNHAFVIRFHGFYVQFRSLTEPPLDPPQCYYIVICCLILLIKDITKPYISIENNYTKMLQLKRLKMIKLDSSNRKIYLHYCLW